MEIEDIKEIKREPTRENDDIRMWGIIPERAGGGGGRDAVKCYMIIYYSNAVLYCQMSEGDCTREDGRKEEKMEGATMKLLVFWLSFVLFSFSPHRIPSASTHLFYSALSPFVKARAPTMGTTSSACRSAHPPSP